MGMPSISISFTEVASTAIQRGERGIIAMIIKDTVPAVNPIICSSEVDVPTTLSAYNQEQIKLALKGYINSPLKVIAYVIPSTGTAATTYATALNYFKTVKFDYLVAPKAGTDNQQDAIVNYVKSERSNDKLIKAVLPNATANTEGVINLRPRK